MNIDLSIVVIGRNEGQRLVDCLQSINTAHFGGLRHEVIYVDSASNDGSPQRARGFGARVILLAAPRPCAAIGRNAGWRAAQGEWVLFLDGDTLLEADFIPAALAEIQRDARHAVVWGHRRERRTDRSIYNRVLDLDWVYPPGESEFCGGDALFRRSVLVATGGYNESLIAGEEPELCARLRQLGYRIRHIDQAMTRHDLAMTRFGQYWKRAERAGHAYAEIAHRLRDTATPLWSANARRNRQHAAGLLLAAPLLALLVGMQAWPALAVCLLLGTTLILRTAWRARWKSASPLTLVLYALHSHLQQLPMLWGQYRWWASQQKGERLALIDYKEGC